MSGRAPKLALRHVLLRHTCLVYVRVHRVLGFPRLCFRAGIVRSCVQRRGRRYSRRRHSRGRLQCLVR